MRSYILSLPPKMQPVVIIASTVAAAFVVSFLSRMFFGEQRLTLDNSLTTSVYGTLGTTYAVLIAFVVSGVWQSFSDAGDSVKREANALSDLTLVVCSFPAEKSKAPRESIKAYVQGVIERWDSLVRVPRDDMRAEEINLDTSRALAAAILAIRPGDAREIELYGQALGLLGVWLDARRSRLRSAEGNTAGALWGLLFAGALVLFAFHGMFVAHAWAVWAVLLLGFSFIVGLAFYLIFSLDNPFTGKLSAKPAPFLWLVREFERPDGLDFISAAPPISQAGAGQAATSA
ncbi:MAG: hypothetical protein ABSD98_16780 [Candidatus Korobacteraceae bacterium]|jgi:hypothetical protein